MNELPRKALSIMQPWAFLIVNGLKDIENRDWQTKYRGSVAIHAGKRIDENAHYSLLYGKHPVTGDHFPGTFGRNISACPGGAVGGIVGVADIIDCVEHSDSPWFVGRYGFVLANQRPVPFIPVKGALGFFDWRERVIA